MCWTFLVSYIPNIVVWVLKGLAGTSTIPPPNPETFILLRVLMISAIAVNVVVNPVIYFYTNEKFRFFVKELMKGRGKEFGRRWQNRNNALALTYPVTVVSNVNTSSNL